MKVITFNINSVRARIHQLTALIDKHQPDVIGLQETKVTDEDFPVSDIQSLGYHAEFHGQKSHYGVALLSKKQPLDVKKGFLSDTLDAQRRMISATYPGDNGISYTVINGYFPQGENRQHPTKFPAKEHFYQDLMTTLTSAHSSQQSLIVMGDFNIAYQDQDIGIGEVNAKRWLKTEKCSFLPEERDWFKQLLAWGFKDCYRDIGPKNENELYSWFDYRSRGFERAPKRGLRIDGILATDSLMEHCQATGIDYDIRQMEKPSDHAPVWADFTL